MYIKLIKSVLNFGMLHVMYTRDFCVIVLTDCLIVHWLKKCPRSCHLGTPIVNIAAISLLLMYALTYKSCQEIIYVNEDKMMDKSAVLQRGLLEG